MSTFERPGDDRLARALPGRWRVAASNLPHWLSGERIDGSVSFALVSADPLEFDEEVSWTTPEGEVKSIVGAVTATWDGLLWRGTKGRLRLVSRAWTVESVSDDDSFFVSRIARSRLAPAGLNLFVRDGTAHPDLRAVVAHATERYGLSPEDFASLTWLVTPDSKRAN